MRAAARLVAGVLAIAAACTPIPDNQQTTPLPPTNACPARPCEAYASSSPAAAPTCTEGVCVAPSLPPGDLVVTVALPEDAFSAPGRTYAVRLADLEQTLATSGNCPQAPCVHLPGAIPLLSGYVVQGSDAVTLLHSTLVTKPITSLPVHVTYQALWPPGASSLYSSALAAGLPVLPVEAQATTSPGTFFAAGPAGPPTLAFQTYLQSRLGYAQIIAVDSPYDQDFPPGISVVPDLVSAPPPPVMLSLDTTPIGTGSNNLPTFDLSRTDGTLDGWTAYLRDATTKTVLSPIKPLSGMETPDGGLVLPTNHTPPSVPPIDALVNTELLMAPPPGTLLPTEVFSYPQTPREIYAVLPMPASVSGRIEWPGGDPVPAEVFFEATAIYAAQPTGSAGDGGADASVPASNFEPQPNFEFVTQVNAGPDSTYLVPTLPRGIYRVTVRPDDASLVDGSQGVVHAVTVVDFDTGDGTSDDADAGAPALTVALAPIVTGTATIADGRALWGATVEAIPTHCAPPGDGGSSPPDSPRCMPRSAQTTTRADGSFSLSLDPGSYTLSVEPADGTRLPWVSQSITVPVAAPLAIRIFAPTHLQLQLADAQGPLIANAVVRLFTIPDPGPAIEVGRAITDSAGRFDMYLDPALP